ncbi:MAG: flagellar hook-length control protein FliK, partial [Planctomycetota bacterium]
ASLTQQGEGLEDVFAQVFAHIAQSRPTESNEGENLTDQGPLIQSSEPVDKQKDDDPSVDDRDTSESHWHVDTFVVDPNGDEPVQLEQENITEETAGPIEVETKNEVEVVAKPVETQEIEAEVVETEVVQTVTQTAAEQDGDQRRERSKSDNPVVEAAPLVKEAKSTSSLESSQESEQLQTNEIAGEDAGQFGDSDDSREPSERGRRLRSRRGGQHAVGANEATQQQARSNEEAILQAIAAKTQSGQSATNPNEAADTKVAENAIKSTAINQAAAAVSQSATSSANASRVNAAQSGSSSANGNNSVRPVESLESNQRYADVKDASKAKNKNTPAAETVSRVKLIQRVSKAFQHLGPEGGTVRLRLAPAELGSVRVEMRIQQRKIQARVVAETEAASTALREHLPELRQRLESQGMQIEQLDVEVDTGDRDTSEFRQHSGEDRQQSPWQSPNRRYNSIERPAAAPAEVSQRVRQLVQTASTEGVDLTL